MKPRYTNLSSIEPHPDYPLKMYYADEVEPRIAKLEGALRELNDLCDNALRNHMDIDPEVGRIVKTALASASLILHPAT